MSFGSDSQRVENAVHDAKEKMTEDAERVVCPKCHHETLATNTDQGDYCFYCRKEYKMVRCTGCHGFAAEEETDEYGLCPTCCGHGSVIVP